MAKRFYDFKCDNDHVTEHFVDSECRQSTCPECGERSVRLISTPKVVLEGTTGAFPGAAMQWERKRAEKLAQERKRAASYGE